MLKWAVELALYDISDELRRAIKAQGLIDFNMECSVSDKP